MNLRFLQMEYKDDKTKPGIMSEETPDYPGIEMRRD